MDVLVTRECATDGAEKAKDTIQDQGDKLGDKAEVRESCSFERSPGPRVPPFR